MASLALLAATASCPETGKQEVEEGEVWKEESGERSPKRGVGTPDTGLRTEEPAQDNPKPTGSDWIYAPKLSYRIGESIPVEYKVTAELGDRAWIGLIPAAMVSPDAAENDAVDVAYQWIEESEGVVEVLAADTGAFWLKLFPDTEAGTTAIAATTLINVTQWPTGSFEANEPPYVTIAGNELPERVVLSRGVIITAYWLIPEAYPEAAWLGLITANVDSRKAGTESRPTNGEQDVQRQYLGGATMGSFGFKIDEPGEYFFRLFPADLPGCNAVAQSQVFIVE
ncbi:hypothetical protein IIA79_05170 [bacterium]|nr:hypothetical protein [bacterium]